MPSQVLGKVTLKGWKPLSSTSQAARADMAFELGFWRVLEREEIG